ncbi:hypothetical protein RvY_05162 [Ramazzottius varieornatus]|uniref:Uncharacterized protein n=1 Tax=Ramazzottius varieornatus TaxID=947166 RepID=A0A1D1UU40_RAMVA|nr:hypothetical protein RvY_05162 [Ramazzottius varieornatus]
MASSIARAKHLLSPTSLRLSQTRNINPRTGHLVPLPPTVKIPFIEKLGLGVFMCAGLVSIPVWVLYNLEYYKTGGARTEPSKTAQREIDIRKETELEMDKIQQVAEGKHSFEGLGITPNK